MKYIIGSRAQAASGQNPGGAERLRFARLAHVGIAGAVLLALSGCQTTRYVTIHCLNPQQYAELRAALPPKVGEKLTGNAQDDLKLIAGSAVELRGYSEGLLQVLKGCTGK